MCLYGLSRLRQAEYEIVVVADPEGLEAARHLPFSDHLKLVAYDEANISNARNLGIAHSAGEVIAFIDDDAIPEPMWLYHLLGPFTDSRVAATGGFVIGRNGISFQWKARVLDQTGEATPVTVDEARPTILTPPPGQAVKTEGTNMAVRCSVLRDLGGFDPVFRFYMDETDLNMRLARAGFATAIVPLAQVHHRYAPSIRRAQSRAVRSLQDIGASQMLFLRKYFRRAEHWPQLIARARRNQKRRLMEQMVDGLIEPGDIRRLLSGFDAGVGLGKDVPLKDLGALPASNEPFERFPSQATGPVEALSGRIWSFWSLRRQAIARAKLGATVSLFVFSHTALFHRVRFLPPGVWLQQGGLWGRSLRSDPLWRWTSFKARVQREMARSRGLR